MSPIRQGIPMRGSGKAENLLSQAIHESSTFEPTPDQPDTMFCRDLYLSSVSYLLRGLPSDLTASEALVLQSSLPKSIAAQETGNMAAKHCNAHTNETNGLDEPSIVHRTLAYLVLQVFVVCHFCLPYLRILLREAYAYERRHHISERALATSLNTFDEVGKSTVGLLERVYAIDEGRFGRSVNETVVWWVREVSGGLKQGLKEGVLAMRDGGVDVAM
ncbi:hypothetical protein EJ05DRAFT_350190 [Pseudovirgaria hyperparasitica]|uniref:Uncharacterized protein n=1 Tax=Pseudovirgaria hyperparasitica TaxID=470096 RepID=A0A6A6W929_9PEZI|nr:uncharacterized protein EJ05DRAFT_350190 [Pseudovirgaria hyperparasitica]KAF2758396.1 hypothetical protein EJ05DRAFT_350190 [Pseudovirgaria hyperparasitica]